MAERLDDDGFLIDDPQTINRQIHEQEKINPLAKPADPVKWPSHYNQGDIECIDAMIAAKGIEKVRIFCELSAFKYQWRMDQKGSPEQDREKAIWYLRFSGGDDPRRDRT